MTWFTLGLFVWHVQRRQTRSETEKDRRDFHKNISFPLFFWLLHCFKMFVKPVVYFRAENHGDTIWMNHHAFVEEQNGGVRSEMDLHQRASALHDPWRLTVYQPVGLIHCCRIALLVHQPNRQETDLKVWSHSVTLFCERIPFPPCTCLKHCPKHYEV